METNKILHIILCKPLSMYSQPEWSLILKRCRAMHKLTPLPIYPTTLHLTWGLQKKIFFEIFIWISDSKLAHSNIITCIPMKKNHKFLPNAIFTPSFPFHNDLHSFKARMTWASINKSHIFLIGTLDSNKIIKTSM